MSLHFALVLLLAIHLLAPSAQAQNCANPENISSFVYDAHNYEIIQENLNWQDAAACAVERGGFLAEINSADEQNAIYTQLELANIDASLTIAPDGGGASYVWLGGNDLSTEGQWFWNGNNDGGGTQFWQGTSSGGPVNGLYSNWGNEPDNYFNQDALGLAITNWPLGLASQWNDVDAGNQLYFLVEYTVETALDPTIGSPHDWILMQNYPNPFNPATLLQFQLGKSAKVNLSIFDLGGHRIQQLLAEERGPGLHQVSFNAENLASGVYLIRLQVKGKNQYRKILLLR